MGCRLRIWNPFLGVGIGNSIFPDFLPIFNIKRQWGTGGESGVSGGGDPILSKSSKKKKIGQKISKICEIGKIGFFLLKIV